MTPLHPHTPVTPATTDDHRFAVGIMVRFRKTDRLRNAAPGPYEVLETLPPREGAYQYRIKSAREPYQRISTEDELELA